MNYKDPNFEFFDIGSLGFFGFLDFFFPLSPLTIQGCHCRPPPKLPNRTVAMVLCPLDHP